MKQPLNAQYWDERYRQQDTPWDMGQISPAIQHFLDTKTYPEMRILIPGAGSAYEAVYLHQKGYPNVYVCDWAETSFTHLRKQAPDFPAKQLLISDFFKLELEVELIVEQTFFCAIDPNQRPEYARKAASLLSDHGRLAGLFWNHEFPQGPPFGGSLTEYKTLFGSYFHFLQDGISPHSIAPRRGRELFLEMRKK